MTKHEIKNPIELAQKTIEDLLNDNLHKEKLQRKSRNKKPH